jgi:hypothetical protein
MRRGAAQHVLYNIFPLQDVRGGEKVWRLDLIIDDSIPRSAHRTSRTPQSLLPLAASLLAVWRRLALGITTAMAVAKT